MTTSTSASTKTSTSTKTRCLRPWSLARAAAREEWVWSHPQDVRGIPERILREDLGDEAAERMMRSASAAAAKAKAS